MQNFFHYVGRFFQGFSLFLTILHHLIWIVIGGAILVGVLYIISAGGPAKLLQGALPSNVSSLLQNSSQSSNSTSGQDSSNNGNPDQSNQQGQSGKSQVSDQEKQCAINILGIARVNQILSGSSATASEHTKIQSCFPVGFQF